MIHGLILVCSSCHSSKNRVFCVRLYFAVRSYAWSFYAPWRSLPRQRNKQAYSFPFSLCTPCHLLVSSMVSMLCTAQIVVVDHELWYYWSMEGYTIQAFIRQINTPHGSCGEASPQPAALIFFPSIFASGIRRRRLGSSRRGTEADQETTLVSDYRDGRTIRSLIFFLTKIYCFLVCWLILTGQETTLVPDYRDGRTIRSLIYRNQCMKVQPSDVADASNEKFSLNGEVWSWQLREQELTRGQRNTLFARWVSLTGRCPHYTHRTVCIGAALI
jgi:hypothetical protein